MGLPTRSRRQPLRHATITRNLPQVVSVDEDDLGRADAGILQQQRPATLREATACQQQRNHTNASAKHDECSPSLLNSATPGKELHHPVPDRLLGA